MRKELMTSVEIGEEREKDDEKRWADSRKERVSEGKDMRASGGDASVKPLSSASGLPSSTMCSRARCIVLMASGISVRAICSGRGRIVFL
jgi:hypothetical protein